jgi:hypothetical protein
MIAIEDSVDGLFFFLKIYLIDRVYIYYLLHTCYIMKYENYYF